MTAFSPFGAYPAQEPVRAAPPPVLVAISDPVPQRRLTVAFRHLLVIPHVFVLYWVNLAAGVVGFVGWWGALFTGRLPQFAVTFLSGVLRWTTRYYAYYYLLTDIYPRFTLDDDPAYPVRVAIPAPQRLNRAAVFFRYFLAIPVGLLASVVILGASTLMGFIAWLIALFAGQLPPSLHLAYAAAIRFTARYYAYFWMLTPAYPGGLYGDKRGAVTWADELPAAQPQGPGAPAQAYGTPGALYPNPADGAPQGFGSPQGYGFPQGFSAPQGYGAPQEYDPSQSYGSPQGYGTPAGYGAAPGYGAPAGYGGPGGYAAPGGYGVQPVFQPATWLLRLTSRARNLVTTFIAFGAAFLVLIAAGWAATVSSVSTSANNAVTAANAISQLNNSYSTLGSKLAVLEQETSHCDHNLTCVTKHDASAAKDFSMFSSQLAAAAMPASAAAAEAKLSADATATSNAYAQLSRSTTGAQYQSAISSTGLLQLLNTTDADYRALVENLRANA